MTGSVFDDLIKKETANQRLRLEFTANPKSLHPLPAKPQQHPAFLDFNTTFVRLPGEQHRAVLPPARDAQLVEQMRRSELPPSAKYPAPMTSNQEYGWNTKPLIPPERGAKWHHGLKQSEITLFAHDFSLSQHESPFASTAAGHAMKR